MTGYRFHTVRFDELIGYSVSFGHPIFLHILLLKQLTRHIMQQFIILFSYDWFDCSLKLFFLFVWILLLSSTKFGTFFYDPPSILFFLRSCCYLIYCRSPLFVNKGVVFCRCGVRINTEVIILLSLHQLCTAYFSDTLQIWLLWHCALYNESEVYDGKLSLD